MEVTEFYPKDEPYGANNLTVTGEKIDPEMVRVTVDGKQGREGEIEIEVPEHIETISIPEYNSFDEPIICGEEKVRYAVGLYLDDEFISYSGAHLSKDTVRITVSSKNKTIFTDEVSIKSLVLS